MPGKQKPVFLRLVMPEPAPRTPRRAGAKRSDDIYVIRITLLGTKPPIWRRVAVPAGFTLAKLHDVIQSAMGWYDCHLHMFRTRDEACYTALDPEFATDWGEDVCDERRVKLCDILREPKDHCLYEYDFGDGWEHRLELQKIVAREPGKRYPMCLAGKRACPPEDSGGVWGYANILAAISDPEHPEHDEYREWLNREFDPEAFDPEQTSARLQTIR